MANVKNQHSVNLFTNKLVNLGKYGQTTPTQRCGLSGGRRTRRRRRRNQRGGGGYGTDFSSPAKGLPHIKTYSDCGVTGSTGVGKQYVPLQKGGGKLTYGDGGSISYGYDKQGSALANVLKGGYAPIQRVVRPQCGGRKRSRRRKRKSRRRKRKSRRRRTRCSKCPSRCCACCKCRGKRRKSCRCRKCPQKCCPCCPCKRKHRRRRTKRRRGGAPGDGSGNGGGGGGSGNGGGGGGSGNGAHHRVRQFIPRSPAARDLYAVSHAMGPVLAEQKALLHNATDPVPLTADQLAAYETNNQNQQGGRRRSRRKRGGGKCDGCNKTTNTLTTCCQRCAACCKCTVIDKNRRSRRRNQRGGYHQYRSNLPDTSGMRLPNGGGYTTAHPPTFEVLNSCVDNYNHFKGAGSASPVLDKTIS